jgi:hypothetical protein
VAGWRGKAGAEAEGGCPADKAEGALRLRAVVGVGEGALRARAVVRRATRCSRPAAGMGTTWWAGSPPFSLVAYTTRTPWAFWSRKSSPFSFLELAVLIEHMYD